MFRDYIPSKRYRDFDYFRIDDVNEQEFVTLVREFDPIIVLSFGTALYSSETLSQLRPPVLNLHTGILPEYRNVHTDFWAYIKNDFSGIGVTLFELTEKIDDGPIISEVRSEVTDEDYLWNVKRKNLSSVSSLIQNLMQQLDTPEFHLDSKSRDGANRNQSKPLWPTPSGGDLINYLIMEIAKVIRKHSPFKKNSEPYP
jgi:methionyl-tRNA formyltransferase